MYFYTQVDVTVPASSELQVAALTSSQSEPKRVVALRCDQNSASIDLIANIDQTRIMDIQSPETQDAPGNVEVQADLSLSEQLYVGFRNGTGSQITGNITIMYEIVSK